MRKILLTILILMLTNSLSFANSESGECTTIKSEEHKIPDDMCVITATMAGFKNPEITCSKIPKQYSKVGSISCVLKLLSTEEGFSPEEKLDLCIKQHEDVGRKTNSFIYILNNLVHCGLNQKTAYNYYMQYWGKRWNVKPTIESLQEICRMNTNRYGVLSLEKRLKFYMGLLENLDIASQYDNIKNLLADSQLVGASQKEMQKAIHAAIDDKKLIVSNYEEFRNCMLVKKYNEKSQYKFQTSFNDCLRK